MFDISFVILNYNGHLETEKLVRSISTWDASKLNYNVIIVDNCSSDDSYDLLTKAFIGNNRIDVIKSERNGGYSYGNNYGSEYAMRKYQPTYIAIANPDIEIDQDTVIKLLETFSVNDRIAMCAPIMKSRDGSYSIYAQDLPSYRDDLSACSIRNRSKTIQEQYKTIEGYENCILTEMIPGSFFVVRADYFSEVGMFDDHVFLYCEERIIGKRLKDTGYLSVKRADLFYVHVHAVTTSRTISEIKRWKILLSSRLYYQKAYENVKGIRLLLLKAAMKQYLLELKVLFSIKDHKRY